jgi:preprotein translocase subunit SecF
MIPKIPRGIDLKGGTLITLQTNQSFNENELQAKLQKGLKLNDVSIKKVTTPIGTSVEIELEQNERIADAELNLRNFYSKLGEIEQFELEISTYQAQLNSENVTNKDVIAGKLKDAQASLSKAEVDLKGYANIVLSDSETFIGNIDRSNATTTKGLQNLVINSFSDAKQSYRNKISEIIRSSIRFESFAFQDVNPSLSEFFVQKTEEVVIWSFVLTAIVVIAIFRSFIPSVAVLAGALADITIALGGMGLFQIPLTLSSIAALLMLIGFSLDTDILLTTKVLKRTGGTPKDRAYEAMKTGIMMAFVSIIGFSILLALSFFTQISTYYYISAVAIFGLVGDIFATWCTNAVILLWDVERRAGEKK